MLSPLPARPRKTLLSLLALWFTFYASFTLFRPALLDDADSVHVEVAREMLLRHDYVTLYANGIRYLEKAPLLYWSMALSMRLATMAGARRPEVLAAAARVPLALSVLALALCCEALARRMFRSARAGLYAALILLSGFGVFIFTRITIPDALVCLWITVAMLCLWRTEELDGETLRRFPWGFAAASALNVLTKGLIGVVFPVGIAVVYLVLTRGVRRSLHRLKDLHPWSSLLVFLAIAAPWHAFAGLANPTQGHPAPFRYVRSTASVLPWGHWQVPLPTDGNVRGWWWFYFMNEHVLRYLNLRVPRDYDTVPLVLFWGLCLVWLMPWSVFVFKALGWVVPLRSAKWRSQFARRDLPPRERAVLLLVVWAAFVLLFFSLSTRQEYYVLPAIPALAVLVAGWLAFLDHYRQKSSRKSEMRRARFFVTDLLPEEAAKSIPAGRSAIRCTLILCVLCGGFAVASIPLLLHTRSAVNHPDLASLLSEHPGDYAMSMGHFLDLNAEALGLFRLPLCVAATSLFGGSLASLWLRRRGEPFFATLALVASSLGFLLAAHLGLQTFAPVISSAQLAAAVRPQVRTGDLVAIHGEYESGSTLGFYLMRNDIHILEGRSSNLWYGSFFPDAPSIFETPASFAAKWNGPQRVFLWQSLTDPPNALPQGIGPVYVLVRSGGKEIVSNQPNR